MNCFDGGLAQLGEHLSYKQEVTGSSPVSSTKLLVLIEANVSILYWDVAQGFRAFGC